MNIYFIALGFSSTFEYTHEAFLELKSSAWDGMLGASREAGEDGVYVSRVNRSWMESSGIFMRKGYFDKGMLQSNEISCV